MIQHMRYNSSKCRRTHNIGGHKCSFLWIITSVFYPETITYLPTGIAITADKGYVMRHLHSLQVLPIQVKGMVTVS